MSDECGAIDGRSVPGPEGPRVLLFSMRNLARHVSRCGSYEFEGVVAECSNVDVVAPRRRPQRGSPLVRYARRVLGLESPTVVLLSEGDAHWQQLRSALGDGRLRGPQVHDARVAAICMQHGVRELWTADRDFSRFAALRTHNPLVD